MESKGSPINCTNQQCKKVTVLVSQGEASQKH